MKRIATLIITLMALAACTVLPTQVAPEPAATDMPQAGLPNPASVYCTQRGYKLEIRTAADGSQYGSAFFRMAAPVTTGPTTGESAARPHR